VSGVEAHAVVIGAVRVGTAYGERVPRPGPLRAPWRLELDARPVDAAPLRFAGLEALQRWVLERRARLLEEHAARSGVCGG
jgi:hypothetical protein